MPRPTLTTTPIDDASFKVTHRESRGLAATVGGCRSIALAGAASPKLMPAEQAWHWHVFPLPELQPIAQGRCPTVIGDGADPMGWSASNPVIRARLDHSHDTASCRARRTGERSEHAGGGEEHGVWTAWDGGTQFVDDRQVMVHRTGGTNDDGERAVGTAARGSQGALLWPASPRSKPSRVIGESLLQVRPCINGQRFVPGRAVAPFRARS